MLTDKLPTFDPTWPPHKQQQWADAYRKAQAAAAAKIPRRFEFPTDYGRAVIEIPRELSKDDITELGELLRLVARGLPRFKVSQAAAQLRLHVCALTGMEPAGHVWHVAAGNTG